MELLRMIEKRPFLFAGYVLLGIAPIVAPLLTRALVLYVGQKSIP